MNARELVSGLQDLVTLPDVCIRVLEMTGSERYTSNEIASVISQDPGLTAQLLKIANSPIFGLASRVETITRAITVIGNQELRELVLATSVMNTFAKMPNELWDMDTFWCHSIHVGLIAQQFAAKCRTPILHPERLFIAGLLHDVGLLAMSIRIPELVKVMFSRVYQSGVPLHTAEKEVFGLDHAEVGAELLRQWGLPTLFQEVTRFHHDPALARQHAIEVAVVHIANNLSKLTGYGIVFNEQQPVFDPAAWDITGLNEAQARAQMKDANQLYEDTIANFLMGFSAISL
ncbi:MAG: HDOD domain-containing protein [Pseudomonadota bacterium]